MKKTAFLFILIFSLNSILLSAQQTKTIYIMRMKQFYGSAVKMDIHINNNSIYKLKSGNRIIVSVNATDTIKVVIVYPLGKKHQSEPYISLPSGDNEIYLNAFYWGEGYNPFKHAGVFRHLDNAESPDFNIEIKPMELDEGKEVFINDELYKDKLENIKQIEYNLSK